MKTIEEMRREQKALEREIENRQSEAIDVIINKLFEHPIAMNSEHYEFLKEIETDLREYKRNYIQ